MIFKKILDENWLRVFMGFGFVVLNLTKILIDGKFRTRQPLGGWAGTIPKKRQGKDYRMCRIYSLLVQIDTLSIFGILIQ